MQNHGQIIATLGMQHAHQILEYAPIFHLGQTEHVRLHRGNHLREMLEFEPVARRRPVRPAVRREIHRAGIGRIIVGVEEILDVPRGEHKLIGGGRNAQDAEQHNARQQ